MPLLRPMGVLSACLFITHLLPAQDSTHLTDRILSFPSSFLQKVSKKTSRLEHHIINKSERALQQLSKEEKRLYRKLNKKDSVLAKQFFQDAAIKYQSFQSGLNKEVDQINTCKEYIPFLDTVVTSIRFLEKANALHGNKLIQQTLGQVNSVQNRLAQADQIKQYLRSRRQQVKEQLGKLGMTKELKRYNKKIYYYNAQLKEYKSILKEPHKLERKAIDLLSKTKPFQDFMRKHSMLALLFRLPNNLGAASTIQQIPGLQTRTQVNAILQQTAGAAGPNAAQLLQSNIQQAQSQLQQIKNKINELGGSSDAELPSFRPNTQRVKSFWKRWELGTNIQSTRSNAFVPATAQLGLSGGYKLNDKSIIGIGIAGSIGFGKDIKHIAITYEGASVRSYLDWKLKGAFWISATYEMNYHTSFTRIEQLRTLNAWQQSGLIGICKKYQISKKFKGRMSLLWDYLSYNQIPRTQPLVFRFGYSIK